jgi:hypothetical protein
MKQKYLFFISAMAVMFFTAQTGYGLDQADLAKLITTGVVAQVAILSAQTLPAQTLPKQTSPKQPFPAQTFPTRTFPTQTLPAQTLAVQTLPTQTSPAQTLPTQIFPGRTFPTQSLPALPGLTGVHAKRALLESAKNNDAKAVALWQASSGYGCFDSGCPNDACDILQFFR